MQPPVHFYTFARLHLTLLPISPPELSCNIVPTEDRDAVLLENRGGKFLRFGADD